MKARIAIQCKSISGEIGDFFKFEDGTESPVFSDIAELIKWRGINYNSVQTGYNEYVLTPKQ